MLLHLHKSQCGSMALLHFRVLKTIRAFSDEVDTGSSQKMRPNKKLERRSDSIGSKSAPDLASKPHVNGCSIF